MPRQCLGQSRHAQTTDWRLNEWLHLEKLRSAFCTRLKWCKRNCSAVERGLALCCCCCCYLSFSPSVPRVRRMCHALVCVCVQCILYCVYLSHALNIVAPSRSCIRSRRRVCLSPLFITCFSVHFPNFNGFGFDYGLAWLAICIWTCIAISISICLCIYEFTTVCVCGVCACVGF